mgnify:CR=1 FL=1
MLVYHTFNINTTKDLKIQIMTIILLDLLLKYLL